MQTLISPCGKLGFIPIPKNASTSMHDWLTSSGWTEKKLDTSIPNFFLVRDPVERLESAISECIFQTELNHGVSIEKQNELSKSNKIIIDLHTLSIVEYLYNTNLNHKKLIGIMMNKHLHTMVNLVLKYYGVDAISFPIPHLNKTEKTQELKTLSKYLIEHKHEYFYLGQKIDLEIYEFLDQHTKYHRLEKNYMASKNPKPKSLNFIIDLPEWQKFIKDILNFSTPKQYNKNDKT